MVSPHGGGGGRRNLDRRPEQQGSGATRYLGVFRFSRRAIKLVWQTSRALTIGLAIGTVLAGLTPGAIAYVGKRLIDAVVAGALSHDHDEVMKWVLVEMGLVVGVAK